MCFEQLACCCRQVKCPNDCSLSLAKPVHAAHVACPECPLPSQLPR